MIFTHYEQYFRSVLDSADPVQPYNNPNYMTYTRLNWFRQQRWLKTAQLNPELLALMNAIQETQQWIVITEPWCGDASHILPFIVKLTEVNPLLELDVQLRDSAPCTIDQYLSGNSRSIPKLIVRNAMGRDLFVWGSRPQACQALYDQLKVAETEYEEIHIEVQNWYNQDKGFSFQLEILEKLKRLGKE